MRSFFIVILSFVCTLLVCHLQVVSSFQACQRQPQSFVVRSVVNGGSAVEDNVIDLLPHADDTVPLGEESETSSMNYAWLEDEDVPFAPQLTFGKYLTMQEKRVVVTIRYSGSSGLKPYYLTVAGKLKRTHPDILLSKRILPQINEDDSCTPTFEVLVDGKVVVGKGNCKIQKLGLSSNNNQEFRSNADTTGGLSVYVSMQELDSAIAKARRRRRPATAYGQNPKTDRVGRDILRKSSDAGDFNGEASHSKGWND